ncbi:2-oxoacid:ferredoxin oxidoreductase subunit beta [Romboutsia sedimentorum]|uniref:2-oxoacid:ferredoxin oxidoreductase subunit beta n=1 Tax=Romboutsia sedimentorum TaxID=1368474 RepID=A0ABT7EG39_9FIRM|nr:2-oxoacid:ferredoxin oxidoreductase subunit beta [Romboutsia sedimentorum]MDK2565000.1 2-oxoacid:ferredoxin oxidoreductase subunit beta [Romboutsia sedimentorum]MDK2585482.1 2-oxoacid:ferredoxin oxidoreductase subunit beta [Romboutsia sedimentorum]
MPSEIVKKNLRTNRLPHIWCPGCGHGILMRAIAVSIEELNIDKDKVCIVSGIGCSSRAAGYMNFNTIHTTHGRALAFATGIKIAKPELHVIVISGDGDLTAIGGNHFIHACRRNIDITTIVFNNNIYGMTGGQYSPTTKTGDFATTAPFGNIDKPFDICELACGAGATFVARGSVYHVPNTIKYIKEGLKHKGFSVVEGLSICPTYYGRKNKKGSAVALMNELRDKCVNITKKESVNEKELEDNIYIGVFKDTITPEYTDEYKKVLDKFDK